MTADAAIATASGAGLGALALVESGATWGLHQGLGVELGGAATLALIPAVLLAAMTFAWLACLLLPPADERN